jgi:hypothetical protein
MKVEAITVAGQFPDGIDLHVNNLRWATFGLDCQIHIFTARHWKVENKWPGVVVHEVDADPFKWFNYWTNVVPQHLKESSADVFVFSQLDTFYFRRLKELVSQAGRNEEIIMNNDDYHSGISLGGSRVYPRLWEGGLFVNRQVLGNAINRYGIRLDKDVSNEWLLSEIGIKCTTESLDGKPLKSLRKGCGLDTLGEFCLYCFFKQIPVTEAKYLVHFPAVETLHRKYPQHYGKFTEEFLTCIAEQRDQSGILLYYLSGCYKWSDLLKNFVCRLPDNAGQRLRYLERHAHEWMDQWQLYRFRQLLDLVKSRKRVLHL